MTGNTAASGNLFRALWPSFLAATAVLTGAAPALADPLFVYAADSRSIRAVDLEGIENIGPQTFRYWHIELYSRPQRVAGGAAEWGRFQEELRCDTAESRDTHLLAYAEDGSELANLEIDERWSRPIQTSMHASVQRIICEGWRDSDSYADDITHLRLAYEGMLADME